MRSAVDNPFQPGSDVVPKIWAGRVRELTDWSNVVRPRVSAGQYERGRVILGEPGLGKSSLVTRIAEQAERAGDWTTPQVRIALGTDPIKRLASAVLKLADRAGLPASREKRIAELIRRVQAISIAGYSVATRDAGADGPEPHVALTDLLEQVGRAAIKQNRVALIHMDEVQNITSEEALSQVLVALGDTIALKIWVEVPGIGPVERHLPIAVYLTGLPEFDESNDVRRGATFSRRFSKTVLEPLSDDDVRASLHELIDPGWKVLKADGTPDVVRMHPDAADLIVELSRGEPFLFQLAGEKAWNAGTGNVITREDVEWGWEQASAEASAHVERVLDRLPPRERQFLEAMASLDPSQRYQAKIAAAAGFAKPTDAGPASQRLDKVRGIIKRGKPYSFRHRAVEAYLTSNWPDIDEE